LNSDHKLTFTTRLRNRFSLCVKQLYDYVIDVSDTLVDDNAAFGVLRRLSVVDAHFSSLAAKCDLSNAVVSLYNRCSHVVGGRYWLAYRICEEDVFSSYWSRPLLHVWRLVERTAHRKVFRRKSIEAVLCSGAVFVTTGVKIYCFLCG